MTNSYRFSIVTLLVGRGKNSSSGRQEHGGSCGQGHGSSGHRGQGCGSGHEHGWP